MTNFLDISNIKIRCRSIVIKSNLITILKKLRSVDARQLWGTECSPNIHWGPNLQYCECHLIWRYSLHVNQVKMRSSWIRTAPILDDGCPYKKRHMHTKGKPWEDGGRDRCGSDTRGGIQEMAFTRNQERKGTDLPLGPPKWTTPATTWISDF